MPKVGTLSDMEVLNQGEKKTKKQKKRKFQNMTSTHLSGGCLLGAFLLKKVGIVLDV